MLGDMSKQARNSQDCGLMKANKWSLQNNSEYWKKQYWNINIGFYKQEANNHKSTLIMITVNIAS